ATRAHEPRATRAHDREVAALKIKADEHGDGRRPADHRRARSRRGRSQNDHSGALAGIDPGCVRLRWPRDWQASSRAPLPQGVGTSLGGLYSSWTATSMSPPPTSTGSMYKRPSTTRPSRTTKIVTPRIANAE